MQMAEHTVTTLIAVDPDDLISFVADISNDVSWRHDLALSETVSGLPGERASVYRQKGTTAGRDDPYLIELVDVDRSSRTAIFATVDRTPIAFGGIYRVSPAASGAKITLGVWVRAKGIRNVLAPFMGGAVRANSTRYLNDLKVLLETR